MFTKVPPLILFWTTSVHMFTKGSSTIHFNTIPPPLQWDFPTKCLYAFLMVIIFHLQSTKSYSTPLTNPFPLYNKSNLASYSKFLLHCYCFIMILCKLHLLQSVGWEIKRQLWMVYHVGCGRIELLPISGY